MEESEISTSFEEFPLDASLTSFYRSGTFSSSASVVFGDKKHQPAPSSEIPSPHHDFLTLLAVCQMRQIDFLGITWDRVLDDNSDLIGLGMTAEVRPGLLNLEVTFAFKRLADRNFRQVGKGNSQGRRHRLYEALISEISVLGHPVIREHDNIIRLEGVCWDYLPGDQGDKVRPVLVFEKAKHGDLGQFMRSASGLTTTTEQRLRLCVDVIRGIATMHSCREQFPLAYSLPSLACSDKYQANPNVQDIIHGDIKPHNVLVFSRPQQLIGGYCGDATNYVAKVADFGYSTCMGAAENTSSSEQVSLPWSPPWNAPEVHRDNYILPFSEAKLSDVFSLGMLCLWLLFQNENLSKSARGVQGEYDWVRTLKEDGKMKSFARDRIHEDQGLDISRKLAIKEFFELTLSAESSRRTGDLHYLLRLLSQDADETEEGLHIPVVSEPEHRLIVEEPLFELPRNVVQFTAADYRLREYVAACLKDEASGCTSENCRRNAAFQLAFCYMTGFGLQRDEGAAFRWIEQSGKINDMMATIEIAAVTYEPYRNQHVIKLISEGYLHEIDHANGYRNLGLLEDSERYYKREIHDMEIGFQNDNVVTRLKLTLADILDSQGKYDEAEMLLKPLVARTETDEWFRKIYTGDLDSPKTRLATVYVNQGSYGKAMELYQSALKSIEERVGKHHPQMLSANVNFASLLQQLGQYQAAEIIVRECLRENKGTLGSDHPRTLTALQNLATLLYDQKHYEQAVEVMQDVIRLDEKLFGPDHHISLISMNNLASMNIKLKYYEAAEEMSRVVWEKMTMILGLNHPHTLTSLSTYGFALFLQDKDDAAEAVFRQSLDGMRKVRGKNHHYILSSMNNLVTLLLRRRKFVEARQIVEPVLDAREPGVVRNIEVLRNFFRIGSSFGEQRMNDIAERLVRLAIEGEELALGKNDTETLESINTLVSLLLEQDNFTEAEAVSRDALKRCSDTPDYQIVSLALMNGLAVALEVQGKLDEAAVVHSQSLEGCEKLRGPDHRDTLTSVNNLAIVLSSQGKYAVAEEMHRRAMEGYVKILGSEHHDTLTTANNLACVIAKQDRLDEAAALYKKTLDGFKKICGPDHNYSQMTKHNLEIVLEKIQRKSQSTILGDSYQR